MIVMSKNKVSKLGSNSEIGASTMSGSINQLNSFAFYNNNLKNFVQGSMNVSNNSVVGKVLLERIFFEKFQNKDDSH